MALTIMACTGLGLAKEDPPVLPSSPDLTAAIRSREAENATLRVTLAGAKIDLARKETEVQDLRAALAKLQQESLQARKTLEELRATVESAKADAASLRAERDQLLRTKAELQAQANEVPLLRAQVAQAATFENGVQNQMRDLKNSVANLTAQLELVKQDLQRTFQPPAPASKSRGEKASPQKQKHTPALSPVLPSSGSQPHEGGFGRIQVRPIQGSPSESLGELEFVR